MEYMQLNNGIKIPALGYGLFMVDPLKSEEYVSLAIETGYRLIDTAQIYNNEEGVGNAVKKSGIKRDEFFIVSKIWHTNAGYDEALKSIDLSLKKLQTDYIDLMLIHMPYNDYYSIYKALETAYKKGIVRSIGISNFDTGRYIDIIYHSEKKPVINQVETHVFNQQKDLQKAMQEYGTLIMAWAPFAEGKNDFFNNSILKSIGEKYNKSAAQIALRFLIQSGIIAIPKTVNIKRMKENFNVFDFILSCEDMKLINSLDTKKAVIGDFSDIEYNKYVLEIKM